MASTAFYTADQSDLLQQTDYKTESRTRTNDEDLERVYEIKRCVQWLKDGHFTKIALQFPDYLMSDAVRVTSTLDKAVDGQVFILGDTSYGSCCVDEIAAQHYSADCLIHYGRSCLSPTQRLPVLYVFGHDDIDVENSIQQFKELFSDRMAKIILLYDTAYHHAIDALKERLVSEYVDLLVSELHVPVKNDEAESCIGCQDNREGDFKEIKQCGRRFWLPSNHTLEDYSMFYIGCESLTLTNLMMSFSKSTFYSYNPINKEGRKENTNVNRMLMKRFYLIEKAKDANIIGVVVGTLGVSNYLQLINRIKDAIKKAGKKSYTFVVGKLNVAKLANFLEIDIFVLVACPENSLLDTSEFYKPVITPHEMECACNTNREWTGEFVTDFRQLLPGGSAYVTLPEKIEFKTDVSLITGRIRNIGEDEPIETGSTAVLPRNQATALSEINAQSAGEFLSSRSWKGLEQKLGESEVTLAKEGRTGIAAGYTHEQSSDQT